MPPVLNDLRRQHLLHQRCPQGVPFLHRHRRIGTVGQCRLHQPSRLSRQRPLSAEIIPDGAGGGSGQPLADGIDRVHQQRRPAVEPDPVDTDIATAAPPGSPPQIPAPG